MGHLATLAVLAFLEVPLVALVPLALAPLIVVGHALWLVHKASSNDFKVDDL